MLERFLTSSKSTPAKPGGPPPGDKARPVEPAAPKLAGGDEAWLTRVSEAADAGDGWFDPTVVPHEAPNFAYDMLAPAWTASNQLFGVGYEIAAELASKLRDSDDYLESIAVYERLSDRTISSPNRKARLMKYLIDGINGLPDESEQRPPLSEIVSSRLGYAAILRPTNELVETIYRHAFGWGPLEGFMYDEAITEIMVDRHDGVFIERTVPGEGSRLIQEPVRFESPAVLERFVGRMVQQAGKSINYEQPTLDMSLPDGSRVNVIIEPVSRAPTVTIRRKRERFYSLAELESLGSFSAEMHEFMQAQNLAGCNVMAYGPTGSGKTTLLTALLDDKLPERRLVIVEDTAEINVDTTVHPNTVWMLTNQHRDMRSLVRNALRMRPDHLILGETRDATAYDLIQAFNSGQTGSISTLHARDPESALVRLTNLVRQAEAAPTEEPARRMVAEAVNLLIFAARLPDGSRRTQRIDEVDGLTDDFRFRVRNVFMLQRRGIDDAGQIAVGFIHNPDYVMGPAMTSLFCSSGLDPDRWTGSAARAAGRKAGEEGAH